jgi:hypothetical protein
MPDLSEVEAGDLDRKRGLIGLELAEIKDLAALQILR